MDQKPLHEVTTSTELLDYRDPGVAARETRAAELKRMIELIRRDSEPQAELSRDWLKAELKSVLDYTEVNRPYEEARDEARAAYAEACATVHAASASVSAATSEDEQDRAELALKKANRIAAAAAEALRAALVAHPEPGPAFTDLVQVGIRVNAETRKLAAAARNLAGYLYADRPTPDIHMARQMGRSATLQDVHYFAIAEHKYKDDADARRLLNLRFAMACDALGLACDRSKLLLPVPVYGASEARYA